MTERVIPELIQASDLGFEHFAVSAEERGETMQVLARHALGELMLHNPELVDFDRTVNIPYVGKIRLGALFEPDEE